MKSKESIVSMIQESIGKNGNRIAVKDQEKSYTYQQLEHHSNQLAIYLRSLQFPNETVIGVSLERSYSFIVALLGIMKAGAAFLPIDTTLPKDRVDFMLQDSGAKLIINTNLNDNFSIKSVSINNFISNKYVSLSYDCNSIKGNQLSYILYTSGTTGRPKGVQVEHSALLNFIEGFEKQIGISTYRNILFHTSISFDMFIVETLVPISLGLTVVVGNNRLKLNPRVINRIIQQEDIDIVQLTPSQLSQILYDKKKSIGLSQIKLFLIGGEPISKTLLTNLYQITRKKTKIYNMYGPTEATVWCTAKELKRDSPITIGNPLENTTIKIYQSNNKQVTKEEEIGEIYIFGKCLSRGYTSKSETNKRFITLQSGETYYKTGDLGYWKNGELHIKGRSDSQIKIRGNRVELEEIRETLLRYSSINNAAICAISIQGTNRIIGFYEEKTSIDQIELFKLLHDKLPNYMIPLELVRLPKIPLTISGKIDFKKLKEIYLMNKKLIKFLKQISGYTGVVDLSENLDFYGFDSLLYMQLIVELETEFAVEFNDEELLIENFTTANQIINMLRNKGIDINNV